jgi:hypothetical protein
MNAAQQADLPRGGKSRQASRTTLKPQHPSLLSYWAFAIPAHARVKRVAFFQPFWGIGCMLVGAVMIPLGWLSYGVAVGVWGIVLLALGAVMMGTAYLISVAYFKEYPGGFSEFLEEYVARRVSRLSMDEFIPRYKAQNPAEAKKIRDMNSQVSLALRAELLRLAQSENTDVKPVCGVLVVGPEHSNKTGALWDAMKQHLGEWTFVRWPHHMDYPADLALHLGHRIVLWLDDLHDFASLGEAAALDQFIQRLHRERRQFLVLSSCRSGEQLQEAKRYFRPLINDLRRATAPPSLKLTVQSSEQRKAFENLHDSPKSVLETIDWLESLRVNTFPWEALAALSNQFLSTDADRDSDEDTLHQLANDPARFVRVIRRADPRIALSGERYDLLRWFRYTFYPRRYSRRHRTNESGDVHYVIEPINVHNLDLKGSRAVRTKQTTDMLKLHPEASIQRLSGSPFAAETLILLGDAYLNHLGENVENAGKLAILCYDGALEALNQGDYQKHFPGAWAAAYVGKGNAALRARNLSGAAAEFQSVTEREAPGADDRPTPRLLIAHAWHGQGDAIAANIPSEVATHGLSGGEPKVLANAAAYFANAASALPSDDPLWAETRLDRANILYVIARAAARQFAESLSTTPAPLPIDAIKNAERACREVQDSYTKTGAPAVWAELQRRLGDFCLIKLKWLAPTQMRSPVHLSDAARDLLTVTANEPAALDTAKQARDYYFQACDVFAPSYLPMSWLDAQIGCIRARVCIARLLSAIDPKAAGDLYQACLVTIQDTIHQIAMLGHSPLDWVDLQLLWAQIEMGIGLLGGGDASAHFKEAKVSLESTRDFLGSYTLLRKDVSSSRTAMQQVEVASLGVEIAHAMPGI